MKLSCVPPRFWSPSTFEWKLLTFPHWFILLFLFTLCCTFKTFSKILFFLGALWCKVYDMEIRKNKIFNTYSMNFHTVVKWFETNTTNCSLFLTYSLHFGLTEVLFSFQNSCKIVFFHKNNCNVSYIKTLRNQILTTFPTKIMKWFTIKTVFFLFVWKPDHVCRVFPPFQVCM